MPQFQTLTVAKRSAPAVPIVLKPLFKSADGTVFTVALPDASGVGLSELSMSISARRVNGKQKTTEKFTMPTVVTETINGVAVPRVVRTARCTLTWEFENTHTDAERNDFVGVVLTAHDPADILTNDTIVKGEGVY